MSSADSEELAMLRQSIERLLDEIAPPAAAERWDREDNLPRELIEKLASIGLCGIAVPPEYGGLGLGNRELFAVVQQLARRSSALASLYITCVSYAGLNLLHLGSEAQKAQLLPGVAEGKVIFALGLSEPNVGADLASVETRAELDGDHIVINGAKRWCSGAETADYIYALVRSGPVDKRRENLSFVLIPTDAPGISMTRVATMGLRGVATNDVAFDDVRIPKENVMGGFQMWDQGWRQLAGPTLEVEKLQPVAIAVGIAEAAVEEAWRYSQERVQFGGRICAIQSIRHMLADAQTGLQACRLMLAHAIDLLETGEPSAVQTSMAKLFVADKASEIVLTCQRVLGAYGYAEGFAMERLVRDILVIPIFGGSSAIQKGNIANLMGLPRN
ncbi:MAG: acyl-CoA dehydrogenase [Phenylobacterium sp.]|nr:acyl-CoA dehydrogenase [Phenylobacterium sp.]